LKFWTTTTCFVVGKDDVLTQQRVHISEEIEDLFIVSEGITENDKIVLEGLRQAKSGKKAEYEFENQRRPSST
jgi:membrane fusion protein (multidrug efflux system)